MEELTFLLYLCPDKSSNMKKIVMVCLGNICRSPAAEEILRLKLQEKGIDSMFEVDSAGTYHGHRGELPDSRMRSAAFQRGIHLTHRSRPFLEEDFLTADMIVVMDDSNYEAVCRIAPQRKFLDKVFRIREFFTSYAQDWSYVPDPYYEGVHGFYLVLDMLDEACENIAEKLRNGDLI